MQCERRVKAMHGLQRETARWSRVGGVVMAAGDLPARPRPTSDRVLSTVLVTDIVGSTARAVAAGDGSWADTMTAHDALVRRQLGRFDGVEVHTTGDGFLALFDAPCRAIRCARAISVEVHSLGLHARLGIHTGEIERRGPDIAGLAVHISARVAALARADEILVSSVVPMLVLGSELAFRDRGEHTLKGVPGRWQVFAVA